jgi:hypothetical protein
MVIPNLDLITGGLSFLFTLIILSYLIGDNPLFRIGVYAFVGISAGYVASVAWWQVLWTRLFNPLYIMFTTPSASSLLDKALLVFPLLGFALILMKTSPRLAGLSSPAMAFIVGVGAAVTIVGAVSGTFIPQAEGTINAFSITSLDPGIMVVSIVSGSVVLAGTIFSLAYFHFGARPDKTDGSMRRPKPLEFMAWVGRIFIGITLGAVFAGVFSAALTAFIERIYSLIIFIEQLLINFGIF